MTEVARSADYRGEVTLLQGERHYLVSARSFQGWCTSGAWRCDSLAEAQALYARLAAAMTGR
jgi:hypothetical protein